MLAVVADEQPPDVGELAGQPVQLGALVLLADRNQPVLVGPQSVSSSGPTGYPLRRRKRLSGGAVFQAPVET